MKKVFLLIALPLVLLLSACSASRQTAATTTTTTTPTTPSNVAQRTVVEIAENSPEYSTLIEAVNTVGLDETLNGPGPFTVFAPTDAAFAKLAEDMNWNEESQDRDQMDRMHADSTNRMRDMDMHRDTMMQNRQDTSMYNRNWNNTRDTMMRNRQDTSMYNRNWNNTRDTMMQNRQDTSMYNRNWNNTRDTMMQNRTYDDTYRSDTIPGRYNNNNIDRKTSAVLLPENQANLKTILQYHVVRGNYDPETLRQAIQAGNGKTELTTVQGEKLTVTMQGNDFVLQDARGAQARITTQAQAASNGVVYRIDQVILPDNESIRNR